MSVQHLIFVHCADACTDAHLKDVFTGLAFGLYPFCVQQEAQKTLLFRRSNASTEKDRMQRLANATDDVAALPAVQAYNSGVPETTRLRVTSDGARAPTVQWDIEGPSVADHVSVIPELLQWTRWDRDAAWVAMRNGWSRDGPAPPMATARNQRLAHALDVVGKRALLAGKSYDEVTALCQATLRDLNAGQREIVLDADGNVQDVV